jgi:hypothetical protein
LQQLEARAAVAVEGDDLAVEQGAADVEAHESGGNGGELLRPVLPRARVDATAIPGEGRDGAVAVVLDFVHPVGALRRGGGESG